jgi:cell division transport system ATP-binding protein
MVRDEAGGGYGDTSGIPRLQPEAIPGAAAAAALTAVQEVQRQTTAVPVVAPDAVQPAPAPAEVPAQETNARAAVPRTNPIILPDVKVDELGVADRLGLSDDDEEVGPTS